VGISRNNNLGCHRLRYSATLGQTYGIYRMTFMIAEIGINHNGSVEIAKRIIDAAKWAGADAVKFQKRTVATVYAKELDKPRESPWGNTTGAQKYGLEFNEHQYDQLAHYCAKLKMPWFASAWDIEALAFLRKYDCPWNKIASAMATNYEFLEYVAKEDKPVYLSTAMCGGEEIEKARAILEQGHGPITLMHCVAMYPCPEDQLNLNCINTLRFTYRLPVGYSGHEASVSPSVVAAVLGAVAIERHITIDRAMYGSDQAASLEPHGFKTLVDQIRKIPKVLGDGVKRFADSEKDVARKLRYWET
jgi:N-acetylneuraminate synthase